MPPRHLQPVEQLADGLGSPDGSRRGRRRGPARAHRGDVLAHESVEQRGLAGTGRTGQGDDGVPPDELETLAHLGDNRLSRLHASLRELPVARLQGGIELGGGPQERVG